MMSMLKQNLFFLVLSFLAASFSSVASYCFVLINSTFNLILIKLEPVLSQMYLETTEITMILLILLPISLTAIPALVYRLVKGQPMPYFICTTWGIWLLIVLCYLLLG